MKRFNRGIYFFIGTVAEFNKLTPVFKELQKRKTNFHIIDSGQNVINYQDFKEYVREVKPWLVINPKANKSSTLIFLFWAVMTLFKSYFLLRQKLKKINRDNSFFIIHGDTVTSTIGAIVGKMLGFKLVHIEAGYFSHNFFEPFPEEICKHLNSWLADIMFAPTDWALENIKDFKGIKISTKYNTNIGSFWWAMQQKIRLSKVVREGKYYLLIIHRQEHVLFKKKWTKQMMEIVINRADKNISCVILNHPLTVEIIKSLNLRNKKIKIVEQLSYPQFLKLLQGAEFVATDSATIQQEAFYLGKPYLGLADYSVQTEGIGSNAILSKSNPRIIKDFLSNYKKYKRQSVHSEKSPAKIIVDYLVNH